MLPLPLDPYIPDIISALREDDSLILTAPPGAGKTSRVPRALHDAGFTREGEIAVLEPRRLAARMAAFRVAEELREKPGQTVGYSIRFENVVGPNTRIRFMTEAILIRQMVRDPDLSGVSVVILDEFHERHIETDLALALVKRIQSRRRGLKLIVMSASMNVSSLSTYLPNARTISVTEKPFPTQIEFETLNDSRPLQQRVASAVLKSLNSVPTGDILVFLPGAAEIRQAEEVLRHPAQDHGFDICLLHGDLPAFMQQKAIEPAERTKVILATNVAETSVTIPGIVTVVDSGLARIAGYSPWSGFPTLTTAKISRSSALQRAGRAGRSGPGRVLRLYTRQDFMSRPEYETPEIKRSDLSETALLLHGVGIRNLHSFPWFDPPSPVTLDAADTLLCKLGAITKDGDLTELGKRMVQLPVHPRLARLILEAERLGVSEAGTLLAALISERDIRLESRTDLAKSNGKKPESKYGRSDLLELLERFRDAERIAFDPSRQRSLGLDTNALNAVRRSMRHLLRILSRDRSAATRRLDDQMEESLLISVLTAYPDRVAKRRTPGSRELILAGGGSAFLSTTSVVKSPLFLVAVDVEEQKNPKKSTVPNIRLASAIEVEWLAALFPESIRETHRLIWNERKGRVEEIAQVFYQQLILEDKSRPAPPSDEASEILASAVLRQSPLPFHDSEKLPALLVRLALLSRFFPGEKIPKITEEHIHKAVRMLCLGRHSIAELIPLSIMTTLLGALSPRHLLLLERETPERIKLASGRILKIHYENQESPWIASRLQDFFGIYVTPTICSNRLPLTIHLLAPNGRAVQVTRDLAGFWKIHYPAIRRELHRRYPKHSWPDPASITH